MYTVRRQLRRAVKRPLGFRYEHWRWRVSRAIDTHTRWTLPLTVTCAWALVQPRSPDLPLSRSRRCEARLRLAKRERGAIRSRHDAVTPPGPWENGLLPLVAPGGPERRPQVPPVRLVPLFWRTKSGSDVCRGCPLFGSGWVTSPVAIIMHPSRSGMTVM